MAWLFSIKWKMSLGFVTLFMLIAGAYSSLTQRAFEEEKIRFLAESQKKEVVRAARTFSEKSDNARLAALSILATYDLKKNKFTPAAKELFLNQPRIQAVEIRDHAHGKILLSLNKRYDFSTKLEGLSLSSINPTVFALGSDQYVSVSSEKLGPANEFLVKVVFENKELFMDGLSAHSLMLMRGNHVIKRNATLVPAAALHVLLLELPRGAQAKSSLKYNGVRYLISTARVPGQNLHFISLVNENQAFGGWNPVYSRMILFAGIAFFLTLIFSIISFRSLGQNVRLASAAAERMALGDFSSSQEPRSYDEAGQLTETLQNIRSSVREKIAQTVTATQNETTRLMARNLLPRKAFYANAHLRLFGLYKPSAKQSREMWIYRQRGSELYLLILTPVLQSTEAALVNSALRSVFTAGVDGEKSLKEMARALDHAVIEATGGQATARALLLQINVEFGEGRWINAGMDCPLLVSRSGLETLTGFANFQLGEGNDLWLEDLLEMAPQERLILFTSGLLEAGRRPSGAVSEKFFLKRLMSVFAPGLAPEALAYRIDSLLPEPPLARDVTIVALDFKARQF